MIENIRKELLELKDKDVELIIDEGRSRKRKEKSKIKNVYNRTFTVVINDNISSFSFADIINETVIIKKI